MVIVTGLLAFSSMIMRAYVRITRRNWGIDDWNMAIACCLFVFEIAYCVTVIFVKLSIGFMLNRIAEPRRLYICINNLILILAVSTNLGTTFYIIFQCYPIQAAWKDGLIADGARCESTWHLEIVYYVCASVNIFTDWATALMPIALLWNVQMNRNTKISVAGILSLGFFTSISGFVRLKYIPKLTSEEHFAYGLGQLLIWSYAEPALGMIAGNIATLRPLFKRTLHLGSDKHSKPQSLKPRSFSQNSPSDSYPSFEAELESRAVLDKEIRLTFADPSQGVRSSVSTDLDRQPRIGDMADDVELISRQKDCILVSHEVEVHRE
ncbi:hypothetical protein ACJQWK_04843 [Exserohilum turcicum]